MLYIETDIMKYKLSSQRPAVITGKALPIRALTKGQKMQKRPDPGTYVNKKGILPSFMKTRPLRVRVGTL